MKKRIQWLILGGVLMALLSFLSGCSGNGPLFTKRPEITGVSRLSFGYSVGNYMYGSVNYELNEKDGVYTATIKQNEVPEEGALVVEVDADFAERVAALLRENEVGKWNGFSKSDKNVLDGDSFHLYLTTTEGETVSASGYMMWPTHYGKVCGGLDGLFGEVYEAHIAEDVQANWYGEAEEIIRYAREPVKAESVRCRDELGFHVTKAELGELTKIETGTVGLTDGIEMYRVDYRIEADDLVERAEDDVTILDGAVVARPSVGAVYVILHYDEGEYRRTWQEVAVTNEMTVRTTFSTPEMLEKYGGNPYTAAAMELYHAAGAEG